MAKKSRPPAPFDPLNAIAHLLKTQNSMLEVQSAHGRRLDGVEDLVSSIADTDETRAKFLKRFGRSRRRAQVYLALDGIRDANDVAKAIRKVRQDVDKEIRHLVKNRLVELVEALGRGAIYRKRAVDKRVGLSHELMEHFRLDEDGRPLR